MNKIIYHRGYAKCYLSQFVHHVGLIDLNSSLINFFFVSIVRVDIFFLLDRNAIICSFTGNEEVAFPEKQTLFLLPRHKFGPRLQEI